MTLEEVKKFITDNRESEEVAEFITSLQTPETEVIKQYKASSEFREELQREGDRRVTSALDKFQKDKLPKLVEEGIKKQFPDETPEQKKIRELEQQVNELAHSKTREELVNKTTKLFNEKKLPLELTEIIQANDDNELTSRADILANAIEKIKVATRDELLKGAPVPPGSKQSPSPQITRDELKTMKPEAIKKATEEGKLDHLLGRTQ